MKVVSLLSLLLLLRLLLLLLLLTGGLDVESLLNMGYFVCVSKTRLCDSDSAPSCHPLSSINTMSSRAPGNPQAHPTLSSPPAPAPVLLSSPFTMVPVFECCCFVFGFDVWVVEGVVVVVPFSNALCWFDCTIHASWVRSRQYCSNPDSFKPNEVALASHMRP